LDALELPRDLGPAAVKACLIAAGVVQPCRKLTTLFGEADAIVADTQAQFAGLSLELLHIAFAGLGKAVSAVRMRMAVSRSMRRTSA
jgi:hypothetical protein